jgi:hypothetical protein
MTSFNLSPLDILHEAEIAIVLSVGGWILMFPVRTFFKKIKDSWDGVVSKLNEVYEEMTTQRTNCLTTLQTQGADQVKALQEMSKTLSDMHLDQKELTGFLKAGR